jgi:hypothetical protein
MLAIGFTNKYFTLWDIQSSPQYSQDSHGHVTLTHTSVIYTYLQNLSMTESEAIAKAKAKGCVNLEVDKELFGRNESWSVIHKGYCFLPDDLCPLFTFGKYEGTKILDCTDIQYLYWFFDKTKSRYAKMILLENGFVALENDIVTKAQFDEIQESRKAKELVDLEIKAIEDSGSGHIVFTPERNLSERGSIGYKCISVFFKDYKKMYYNGFYYGLPIVDGSAKQIKGKEIVLLVRVIVYDEQKALEVIHVKSIDGKQFIKHLKEKI